MKIIRIDTSNGDVSTSDLDKKYEKYSARGLVSSLSFDEIDPTCDALGKNNKIFLASGFLAGTSVTSSGRVSLGTKSPLTNGIKESSSGGTLGMYMGRLNIRSISIEGMAENDKWRYVYINKDTIKLVDAKALMGLGCYDTTINLIKKYGDKVAVMSIGPAGEKRFLSACISVTDKEGEPTRQFGRGGVGAVLGSKQIKAIVIDGSNTVLVNPKNETLANNYRKILTKKIMENPVSGSALSKFGTGVLVNIVNNFGALPTNSFTKGSFDFAENISGEQMSKIQQDRGGQVGHSCMPGCVIRCSNVYNDKNGKSITGGLEYESMCLLGSNLGIRNLDDIAKLNRLCDDVGVDSIEFGVAAGIAMDSGYIKLGNYKECRDVLQGMYQEDNLLSRIIGQGAKNTGIILGNKRIPHVKGQAMAAYDPRALLGMGAIYCSSPMGADHTAGASCTVFMKSSEDEHIDIAGNSILKATALENTGLCRFTGYSIFADEEALEALLNLIKCYCDIEINKEEYYNLGKEIIKKEFKFNELAGFSKKDDRIPEFMLEEKLEPKLGTFTLKGEDIDKLIMKLKE